MTLLSSVLSGRRRRWASPCFKGQRREVVAQDYVYAFQRLVDPANLSPQADDVVDYKIKGLAAARDAAVKGKKPFDYDAPIEGLRALDRFTLRFELEEPRPRFVDFLASSGTFGAVAREVVEFYGAAIGEHPVGSGPFRLKTWRRNSEIVVSEHKRKDRALSGQGRSTRRRFCEAPRPGRGGWRAWWPVTFGPGARPFERSS